MLAAGHVKGDRVPHAIGTIERNASALAEMIDDLLDVSRIIAGTLEIAHDPVDLIATAHTALDAFKPLAAAKKVVEDHPDSRELMSTVLEQAGASVTAVTSVKEAFQVLETRPPHALVSDIGLPDEDGYALIRRLRRREAKYGGFLPAVALTGYVRDEDRARVLAAGYQAHVPKPVEAAVLTAAVAALTRSSGTVSPRDE